MARTRAKKPARRKPGRVSARRRVAARKPQPSRASARAPLLTGLTILVVEDHEDTRLILRQALEAAGASVKLAQDGYEGLAELAKPPQPDLILCDLLMPAMDGLAFARRVHADPTRAHTPIIAVTALGAAADYIRTWSHGFQGHLVKPVESDHLVDIIRRFLVDGRGFPRS